MSDPTFYTAARVALQDAGYNPSDPGCRRLVELINLAAAPPRLDPRHFTTSQQYRLAATSVSRQFGQIKRWLRIARSAGVNDSHVSSVASPAENGDGARPYGELILLPGGGWRYVPPDTSHLSKRGTLRRAVISALQSAIWQAERSQRRAPISKK